TTTANEARDTIQIAGTSTVLPFNSVLDDEFGNTYPQFNTHVVDYGGNSAGLKQICQGVDDNTIDVENATRKIKSTEIEACNKAAAKEIQEIQIGYDGLVSASISSNAAYKSPPSHEFAA
ncbi:substrate-binding domain-containing protein, partial [Acinetobacter baumannii]|uniref:substrate-binding domain-containing protein n=1 Tax=Acinetobacter baumannii TaxID=470 RepID=UPI000A58D5F6